MEILAKTKRLFPLLVGVIMVTYIALTWFNSLRSAQYARGFITERELPVLGLAISGRIDAVTARVKAATEELLKAGVVRDWILSGEKDPQFVQDYLEHFRAQHDFLDVGCVSDRTEMYYGSNDWSVQMSKDNWERDGWYYLFRDSYESANLDTWFYPDTGVAGLFVNLPLLDKEGGFLGCVGIAVDTQEYSRILESFEGANSVDIYMARQDGQLIYATDKTLIETPSRNVDSLWGTPVLEKFRREQRNPAGSIMELPKEMGSVLWVTYMRDWDTYLITERSGAFIDRTQRTEMIRSLIGGSIMALSLSVLSILAFYFAFRGLEETNRKRLLYVRKLEAALYAHTLYLDTIATRISKIGSAFLRRDETDILGSSVAAMEGDIRETGRALELLGKHNRMARPDEGFSVDQVTQDVLVEKGTLARQRGIIVHTRAMDSIPGVSGNERLFQLVMDELVSVLVSKAEENSEILVSSKSASGTPYLDFAMKARIDKPFPSGLLFAQHALEAMGASLSVTEGEKGVTLVRIEFSRD